MSRNLIETIMGGVVLLVAGYFLVFAYSHADLRAVQGYELEAHFARVGGLDVGSDVRINGIKVGTVMSQSLDPRTFDAVVRMSIRPDIQLPTDTVAAVASEGLMGDRFIRLDPGRASETIAANGRIERTRDFRALEEMVGEIIFMATEPAGSNRQPAPAAPAPQTEGLGGGAFGSGLFD
ncbi:outer membrane lipid asymmetry maintenance protein MlaD [Telmatospirillum sp. J64-1]|uniref:outer membrane lipid asymmetry maintenance protein MlaD n=1 Tax=Telmatospirillum sp. J64-1 TaxID=2502183 RepID=UPI00115EA398|nr:outer membrane lipid asymmetry maintenance protein MlaD [Telmatospirillum sp. J64-1]